MIQNSLVIKQAVILCAGLGTRLRPLTDTIPKPMIPLLGKPLLEWNIEQFKKHGVREFFINLHHLPDIIKNHFGDGSGWGVKITYNFEPQLLGTAGGLKKFEDQLDDVFFAIYGDILSLYDYSKYVDYFKTKPDAIGVQTANFTEYGRDVDLAELDENKLFVRIHPKPHSELPKGTYTMRGIFILKKEILKFIPEGTYYEIGKDLTPNVIEKGKKFYGYECDDFSRGIDNLEKLQKVEEYLKNR